MSSPSQTSSSDKSTEARPDQHGGQSASLPWQLEDEEFVLAEMGRRSFRAFAKHVFGISRHPAGSWWDEAVHGPLCDWFEGEINDWWLHRLRVRTGLDKPMRRFLAVVVPRNCGKSVLITRAGMLWMHLRDPDLSTYIGAATRELAILFLSTIRDILEGNGDSYWHWLYGNWEAEATLWRQDEIIHGARRSSRGEQSFAVLSALSGSTGKHPDVICLDDLVTREALENAANWLDTAYAFLTSLIPVVERDGLIILPGTRYGDGDPFGRSFAKEGIKTIAGMADDPDYRPTLRGVWRVFFLSGRRADGTAAIPTCWTEEAMQDLQHRDPVYLAFQVLNRPKAPELIDLSEAKFDSLIIQDHEVPQNLLLTIHFDKAFNYMDRKARESETAVSIAGHSRAVPGQVVILDSVASLKWGVQEMTDYILERAQYWTSRGHKLVAITDELEPGGNAGLMQSFLYNAFVDKGLAHLWPDYHTFNRLKGGNKDARISASIAFINQGMVKFRAGSPGLPILKYQLCNHPFSAKKDLSDAFADAFHSDIYSGKVPKAMADDNPKDFIGAYEDKMKGQNWWMQRDNMEEFDRQPIGALRQGASPRR